jgi:mono/diheme cytochrome c family protein
MAKQIATLSVAIILLIAPSTAQAVEPFRTFNTVQGHSMTARFIGYKGNQIHIEGQDGQRFALPYESLQPEDQRYCSDAVSKNRVQQVVPPAAPAPAQPEEPVPTPPSNPEPSPTPPAEPESSRLRSGSFFSHKIAPLGVDPSRMPDGGGMPAPGEPIDFQSHMLPIIQDRCIDCHGAPFQKNGKTITPKAGLRLDTYEMVLKGTLDGPVVKPGNVGESVLIELITLAEDDSDIMPPKGDKLTPEQIGVFTRWVEEGSKPSATGSGTAAGGSLPAPGQPVDYETHIKPIFAKRCLDCHGEPYVKNGRTITPKAGLRLDTYETVMKGTLDGPVVISKNIAESTLYILVNPEEADDTEIMPPKGDSLAAEQIDAIKRWILEGALPKAAATAVDPNAVQAPTTATATNSFHKATPLDELAKRARAVGKPQIAAAEKTGAFITPLSKKHSLLRVEFSSNAPNIDDSALQRFSNIRNNISHLDLSRTKVTDRGMGALRSFYNLTWLSLRMTSVGDDALTALNKLPSLWYINLVGTEVTDKGIQTLASIPSLKEIYLWNSKVSADGAAKLQTALPNAKIIYR